jgi:hypothetical protein
MAWRGRAPPTFGILFQRLSLSLLLLLLDFDEEEHEKVKGKNIWVISSQPTLPLLLRTLAFSHTGDSLNALSASGSRRKHRQDFLILFFL